MSDTAKRGLWGGSLLATLVAIGIVLLFGDPFSGASQQPPIREIVLEARDLAFGGTNPTLRGRPGERIRLVVRNTDPGVLHSITVPGLDPEVRHVAWGEQVVVELTLPQQGSFEYVCPQHAPKMKGKLVVEP